MSQSIDQAFIKQFESEVQEAYQQRGSKLRGLVRTKTGVVGKSTTFQKTGRGMVGTKPRHGKVPVMNVDHTPVECVLSDTYGGDFVDKLDELKTNINERQVLANAVAWAQGRHTDSTLIAAMLTATNTTAITLTSKATVKQSLMAARAALGTREVPDDGNVFAAVSWRFWEHLMNIEEFVNADYIGPDLPFTGSRAGLMRKTWGFVHWITHSDLPIAAGTRTNFMWHTTALGHAIGADQYLDWTWQGERQAWFVASGMSQGAVLIDNDGVQEMTLVEATAIPAT